MKLSNLLKYKKSDATNIGPKENYCYFHSIINGQVLYQLFQKVVAALQGWVSIHRKIMNNPVWQDPQLLKLWMLCLLEASHKEHEQLVGRQIIKLQPGQFVTGRFALAKTYNDGAKKENIVPERTLWRWIKMFESYEFVTIKSNTKYSVVTIKNWNQYQHGDQQMSNGFDGFSYNEQKSDQPNDQQNGAEKPYIPRDLEDYQKNMTNQMTNECPASDQRVSTNNNGNKGNNDNNLNNNTTAGKRILDFWDANGFGFGNLNAKNKLLMYLDEGVEEDVILRALEIACESNKISYSYVAKVLNDWSKRGLTTIKLVDAAEAEFQKQKQMRAGAFKKPIRQEVVPEYMYDTTPQSVDPAEEQAKKQAIMDKIQQFRGG